MWWFMPLILKVNYSFDVLLPSETWTRIRHVYAYT